MYKIKKMDVALLVAVIALGTALYKVTHNIKFVLVVMGTGFLGFVALMVVIYVVLLAIEAGKDK